MNRVTKKKGSALITVVMLIFVMALLTASMLKYSGGEQRSNERQRLILRCRNMTENVVLYASEQITNRLRKLHSSSQMAFMGVNEVQLPPTNVLTTKFSTASDVEVRAGLTDTTGLVYIDPTLAINKSNKNKGLQISTSTAPIIAKATMRHSSIGEITTYARQDLEVTLMPLFQFAIFYNMDMEFGPGPNMTISGPVHTNGDFIARIQTGFTNTLKFTDRVSTAKGFYADTAHKGSTYMANGSVDNGPGGTGPLIFQKPDGTPTDIRSGSTWRDHKFGQATETATTRASFKDFATTAYDDNLRTSEHGVTKLELPDVGDYDESNPAKKKNGRQVVEAPASADTGGVLQTKVSRNVGLYIVVNPDDETRIGKKPDGANVSMRARSYRAWLNGVNSAGTHTMTEVVLPGQPSYGDLNVNLNTLPNAYRVNSAVGSNQVLRIPKGGDTTAVELPDTGYAWSGKPTTGYVWTSTAPAPDFDASPTTTELLGQDAYFYDMRRAFNNVGSPFNRSSTNRYRPRPIAKIDFDMTRFKMAVNRTVFNNSTSTVYYPSLPSDTTTWNASIYNPSATPASFGLGLAPGTNTAYDVFPTRDTVAAIQASQAAVHAPATLNISSLTQTGVAASALYAGRFKIAYSTDNGVTYTDPTAAPVAGVGVPVSTYQSATDESSVSYTPPVGATHIRIRQYVAGNFTNQLDEQIIPIVCDTAPLGIKFTDPTGVSTDTTGRFRISETTAAAPGTYTVTYTSAADEATLAYTPTAGAPKIKVEQFAPGGTTTLIRTQIIPVVTAALTNDYHIVPVTNSTSGFLFANAVTEMRVYVGGIDDTANWTYSASTTGSVTGSLGSGPFANRYTATGMSSSSGTNTGTVVITASKPATGSTFTTITKTFTLYKQSSTALTSPAQTGYWLAVGGLVTPDPFKIYKAPTTAAELTTAAADPSSFALTATDFVGATSAGAPWFDGITVYIHSVDAEVLTVTGTGNSAIRNRVSSGVRLWNGRGSLVSLPGATYPNRTGLTFATNDAAYIVGHYNADGTTDSALTDTFTGGYSGRYPESASEMLTSVMGDAITILSQPEIARSGSAGSYTYYQSSGWSDSLSANTRDSSASYDSSNWASSNPSNSNTQDGLQASILPAYLPNLTVSSSSLTTDTTTVTRAGPRAPASSSTTPPPPSARTAKFAPSETEVSTCLLTGIVPTTVVGTTTTGQTSGGVHNFPRLSENWAGSVALYIRGSLVAMFESQVATEPWSIRYYQGAIRNWGLHQSLRDANHDLPLEPIVVGANRLSYRELTPAEYAAEKTVIESYPH